MRASADLASVECCIYFTAHHRVRLKSLSIRRVANSARFDIALSGEFDLQGYGELDSQNIPLTLRGEVAFDGVVVVPDNFFPTPSDPTDVIRLLAMR